jgi:hypothetical protein
MVGFADSIDRLVVTEDHRSTFRRAFQGIYNTAGDAAAGLIKVRLLRCQCRIELILPFGSYHMVLSPNSYSNVVFAVV